MRSISSPVMFDLPRRSRVRRESISAGKALGERKRRALPDLGEAVVIGWNPVRLCIPCHDDLRDAGRPAGTCADEGVFSCQDLATPRADLTRWQAASVATARRHDSAPPPKGCLAGGVPLASSLL